MAIGVKTFFTVTANVTFTTNIVLATVGLTSPIAANQNQKFRAWIPFTVGATGGVRVQVVTPAGIVLFITTFKLFNTIAQTLITAIQTASAAFTNALASAGNHWLEIEGDILNGVTAGNVDIQIAQNTSDAATLTVLKGGSLDVVKF